MEFAKRLKEARVRAELTQEEVAALAGVTKSAVSSWENGTREPSIEKIHKLMDILGVPAGFLFGDPRGVAEDTADIGKWFSIWMDDRHGMIETMAKNMGADLAAGYSYFGESIQKQQRGIEEYRDDYERQLMAFADMTNAQINRWCYFDLLRRGAITR